MAETPLRYKIFNDPIHGNIELHPLCVKIIDTPQFQRLRHIKQLGGCYFVFPGASHNRFEHSIGVCHLAGKFVEKLRSRQPELNITDTDVLCLRIAGLCHDLGQGPFSCVFESRFMPYFGTNWKPETTARKMFEHMLYVNNLKQQFEDNGLNDDDITLIKELIDDSTIRVAVGEQETEWTFKGRSREKSFLYQIVSNKRTGLDVDRWDSLARDSKHLGIRSNFDYKRLQKFTRVIWHNGVRMMCIRDKEVDTLLTMHQTFVNLCRNACKHKATVIIEYMIGEALRLANESSETMLGPNGDKKMSDSVNDMEAFTELTDSVYYDILHSDDDELKPARDIIERIQKRQHYRCIAKHTLEAPCAAAEDWDKKIRDAMGIEFERMGTDLTESDIVVLVEKFNYGEYQSNPVNSILYYKKQDPDVAIDVPVDQVSDVQPDIFAEDKVFVYCKRIEKEKLQLATTCFRNICDTIRLIPRSSVQMEQTPDDVDYQSVNTNGIGIGEMSTRISLHSKP